MEHYLDELLAGCGVSRANLIYSGGGHCYVLLPNTAAVADTLTRWNRQFNRWLQQQFGTQLFLANAWTPCSGNDLTNTPAEKSPYKELFRRVNRLLEQHKFHRYTAEDLRQLNSTAAYPDGRECKVCGTSANLKDDLCPWCKMFVDLSNKIQNKRVLVVSRQPSAADDCTLPALDGDSEYLSLTDPLSARKRLASGEPVARVYTKMHRSPALLTAPTCMWAITPPAIAWKNWQSSPRACAALRSAVWMWTTSGTHLSPASSRKTRKTRSNGCTMLPCPAPRRSPGRCHCFQVLHQRHSGQLACKHRLCRRRRCVPCGRMERCSGSSTAHPA